MYYSNGVSGGGGGDGDAIGTGVQQQMAVAGQQSFVTVARGSGGEGSSTWGGHSSHVFIESGGYVGGCGDIFPRRR